MTKDMMKMAHYKAAKCVGVSVWECSDSYGSADNAALAGERFIQLAANLPEPGFLGWQLDAGTEGEFRVTAFSGPEVQVAEEDFGWVFQQCATVQALPREAAAGMWGADRKIYALRYMPEEPGDGRSGICSEENGGIKYHCQDLLHSLETLGAAMRITAGAARGGAGMVFVSLPQEMPLRLRALLSLSFSGATAVEVEEDLAGFGQFSGQYLTDVMATLLGWLMNRPPKQEPATQTTEETDATDTSDAEQEKEKPETIRDLDFSVRTFNCLYRAGIRTVEDLCALTEDDILNIRNIGRRGAEEIRNKLAELGVTPAPVQESVPAQTPSELLGELIGLENVKEQVKRIAALAKMKKDMAALGKATVSVVLNMEFVGNPGTAKTTVARIIAGIFHEIGLLSCREVVEVGRADLVGQYVGHTADKVKTLFHRAKGKLLFIDEAYSLVDKNAGQFADEAINTIVQEMENHREETVVIFAGYPDKMKAFFAKNPGLRSRVPFHIHFSDYSPEEMVQIAELEAGKRGFSIRPEAREKVASICAMAAEYPDMGNGRFSRNLVESAVLSFAFRVYGSDEETAEKDFALAEEDFAIPEILRQTKKTVRIGFSA